jgi:hypothetical protein
MKGYKVFNPDWTCRGFRYEVGKTFDINGEIGLCDRGFHFCQKASDCFNYYSFDSKNKVAEIYAHGEALTEGDKTVTNKIEIVREISWQELLTIVNDGRDNTGRMNTGDSNTGDSNAGHSNTGHSNTGHRNTGHRNTGDWNTGHRNTGHSNTGDWNTGDWNTGDWNITNYSSGIFCTEEQKALIFDHPSNITLSEWRKSKAYLLLKKIDTVIWVYSENMTAQEKEQHPKHETTGGFLKTIHIVEASEKWWSKLTEEEKSIIKSIPNFDSEKFYKITGLKV